MGSLNMTTKRLQLLEANGYYLTKMSIVNIRGWFSNTYLVIFEKGGTPIIGYDVARYWKQLKGRTYTYFNQYMSLIDKEKRKEYKRQYYLNNKEKNKCEHDRIKWICKQCGQVLYASMTDKNQHVSNAVEARYASMIE